MLNEKARTFSVVVAVVLLFSSMAISGCIDLGGDEEEILLETTLYVPNDERADEMEVLQEQAREAGIKINLETLEWGSYIEAVQAGNAPLSYSGWSGPTAPAGTFNYMQKGSPWAFYSGWYENETFTSKIDQAVATTDQTERNNLYHEAQEVLVDEDMGVFIMYTQRNPRAYHSSVDIPEESWNSYMGAGPLVVADEWNVSGSDTIEVAQTHEPADFHPIRYTDVYSGYIFLQMFEPLVTTYPEGAVTTDENTVAENYDIVEDAEGNMTYTFDIKDGITFHNGEELDAHDVEFSINTMMPWEKEYMGPNEGENYTDLYDVENNPSSPRAGDFANVDYVEATDNHTVKMHMKSPDVELLQKEGIEYLNIVPKDYIEDNGWDAYEDNLIGSGPYELSHYEAGNEILLEEYENHRNNVNTPNIRFNFYDEESTAVTALRDGDAHYMSRISPTNYYDLEDEDQVNTNAYPYMGHNRIAFNHNEEPFDDPRVRKAFAYAINVDEIIEAVQGEELADNTRSPVPSNHPAHNPDLNMYDRDTEKARDLLNDAGYTAG